MPVVERIRPNLTPEEKLEKTKRSNQLAKLKKQYY